MRVRQANILTTSESSERLGQSQDFPRHPTVDLLPLSIQVAENCQERCAPAQSQTIKQTATLTGPSESNPAAPSPSCSLKPPSDDDPASESLPGRGRLRLLDAPLLPSTFVNRSSIASSSDSASSSVFCLCASRGCSAGDTCGRMFGAGGTGFTKSSMIDGGCFAIGGVGGGFGGAIGVDVKKHDRLLSCCGTGVAPHTPWYTAYRTPVRSTSTCRGARKPNLPVAHEASQDSRVSLALWWVLERYKNFYSTLLALQIEVKHRSRSG